MATEEWKFHFRIKDRLKVLCTCEYMKLLLMSLWATSVKTSFNTVSFSIGVDFVMSFPHRFWGKKAVTIKEAYSTGVFLYWRFYVLFKTFIKQQCTNPLNSSMLFVLSLNFFLSQTLFFDREKNKTYISTCGQKLSHALLHKSGNVLLFKVVLSLWNSSNNYSNFSNI